MKSADLRRRALVPAGLAAALLLGLGAGALVERAERGGEPDLVASARASASAVASRAATLQRERDRLRLERDQLEARLAAEEAPRICPAEFVSTADADLLPFFSVDYPCGWHAFYDARSATTGEDRPGLHVEVALFSRLPIALVPRATPIADVELADWSDDASDQEDALPSLEDWLDEERERFSDPPKEDQFEAGDGITVHRLAGSQRLTDDAVTVVALLWEYEDTVAKVRHVVRAFSVEPSRHVRAVLDRMARSFGVLKG